jgi:hypothetical protein
MIFIVIYDICHKKIFASLPKLHHYSTWKTKKTVKIWVTNNSF